MDLEMRTMEGRSTPFINAAVHAVLFYVTTLVPPLLLVTFFTTDKRCLHDILADVIVLRRSEPTLIRSFGPPETAESIGREEAR